MAAKILNDNKIVPDDEGKKCNTTTIAAVAQALPHKSFPRLFKVNNDLPKTKLDKAPTINAASVAQAAATGP